jgi:hypothetical protein
MIHAYILIEMQLGFSNEVINKIMEIDEVRKASIIAGDFDIIVRVKTHELEQLHLVTSKIQQIKGINKTVTGLIEKELSV